ncbi:tRNA methyltransferase [Candidatus Saccharibacteria bacterium]|nr:MAG: tRNA methyltransferase [Candidatus Saccharibacteria bacterium]
MLSSSSAHLCYSAAMMAHPRRRITLIAHNIRSTHNVGAIFRTAEGFGVSRLILSGYTPYPSANTDRSFGLSSDDGRLPHEARRVTAAIRKTALGAEQLVPFSRYDTLDEWLEENRRAEKPLPLVALEQAERSLDIGEFSPPAEFALLLGEEVNGIEPQLLAQCDHVVEIPMYGQKESFNVSVAAGIALYALGL